MKTAIWAQRIRELKVKTWEGRYKIDISGEFGGYYEGGRRQDSGRMDRGAWVWMEVEEESEERWYAWSEGREGRASTTQPGCMLGTVARFWYKQTQAVSSRLFELRWRRDEKMRGKNGGTLKRNRGKIKIYPTSLWLTGVCSSLGLFGNVFLCERVRGLWWWGKIPSHLHVFVSVCVGVKWVTN